MATVKDIANRTGYSASTVSIVLSGKSDERKIPEATRQKIWDAARELGYRPNMSARRLRTSADNVLYVAVYWTSDSRSGYMNRFLIGLRQKALRMSQKVEFIIKPYERLKESFDGSIMYHAAIVCNASEEDLEYLESIETEIPVVLYNRHSKKYDSVEIDYEIMGKMGVDIFREQGSGSIALLSPEKKYPIRISLEDSFRREAEGYGIEVWNKHAESMRDSVQAIEELIVERPDIRSIFSASTNFSFAVLNTLFRRGLRIPEDYRLLGVGSGDPDMEEYALIPISTLQIPREEMAGMCLEMVLTGGSHREREVIRKMIPPVYRKRKSC